MNALRITIITVSGGGGGGVEKMKEQKKACRVKAGERRSKTLIFLRVNLKCEIMITKQRFLAFSNIWFPQPDFTLTYSSPFLVQYHSRPLPSLPWRSARWPGQPPAPGLLLLPIASILYPELFSGHSHILLHDSRTKRRKPGCRPPPPLRHPVLLLPLPLLLPKPLPVKSLMNTLHQHRQSCRNSSTLLVQHLRNRLLNVRSMGAASFR